MTPTQWNPPAWVRDAVFYQIFPERFANGDPSNDAANSKPWGTTPTLHNLMGGDLQGIIDHLDYLQDLGVTALYLNPIFQATTSHKYNTLDYFKVDPHFGTQETFRALVDELHRRNMKLILDAVFNHCGRGFFAFHDVVENGPNSPYVDWFHITRFPINPYNSRLPANYQTWWDFRELPKFNTDNPQVRSYLLDVARYWIEQGADGWRLDVPNEIADHDFWREFRNVVKDANPDAYIVGEIWHDGSPWLQGDQFDAVMNYIFRDLCSEFFAEYTRKAADFGAGVNQLITLYDPRVTYVQFNLLSSHDTKRFMTKALTAGKYALERVKLAIVFQMTFPGAPCIYYGDEIGMQGGKDPDCRRCFPWEDQASWNHDLLDWIKRHVALRHQYTALRTGHYKTLMADNNTNVYAFTRWDDDASFVIVLNNTDTSWVFDLPLDSRDTNHVEQFVTISGSETYSVEGGKISEVFMPAWGSLVLRANR